MITQIATDPKTQRYNLIAALIRTCQGEHTAESAARLCNQTYGTKIWINEAAAAMVLMASNNEIKLERTYIDENGKVIGIFKI